MVQQQLTLIPSASQGEGRRGLIWKQQGYWRNYLGKRHLKSTEIYFFSEVGKDSSFFTNIVDGANKANPLGIEQLESKR